MDLIHSPAKLNLFLEVTEKRTDGYHNIDSVFLTINLADDIKISLLESDKIDVTTNHPEVPDGEKNIIYTAVTKIKELKKIKSGVKIAVTKNIPVGGGLGGGSGNAGAVIGYLADKWGFNPKSPEILELAKSIGADVPFFLHKTNIAVCGGIGEIVTPIGFKGCLWLILVNPGININTGEVYRNLNLTNPQKNSKIIIDAINKEDLTGISLNLFNRLEEPVLIKYPVIAQIKKDLLDIGCTGSLMSGSGSTVFGLAENERQGKKMLKLIREKYKGFFSKLVRSE